MTVPQLITIKQAAEALCYDGKYGAQVVRGLIQCGKLRAFRVGRAGQWRIFEDSLASLLGVRVPSSSSQEKAAAREEYAALVCLGLTPSPELAASALGRTSSPLPMKSVPISRLARVGARHAQAGVEQTYAVAAECPAGRDAE